MRKSVNISRELWVLIVKYVLMGQQDVFPELQKGLNEKLNSLLAHEYYSKYKTAPTPEQQEQARLKYLDLKGISEDFRYL